MPHASIIFQSAEMHLKALCLNIEVPLLFHSKSGRWRHGACARLCVWGKLTLSLLAAFSLYSGNRLGHWRSHREDVRLCALRRKRLKMAIIRHSRGRYLARVGSCLEAEWQEKEFSKMKK